MASWWSWRFEVRALGSFLDFSNTGGANYKPKLQKKQWFLAAPKRWVWISDNAQSVSLSSCNSLSCVTLMLSPCTVEVNPPQRDMNLKLLWFI